jgi:MFS family permease
VDVYLIGFGGVLLLAGRVGGLDRAVTCAADRCGCLFPGVRSVRRSPEPGALIAARFVQGLGGSLAPAVALGMVSTLFEDERARTRAVGIYAMVGAVGASIGLFLGGVITAVAGWRWSFGINVPIGLLTVLVGWRVLPRDGGPGLRSGADALGAALLVGGVMSGIAAIIQEPVFGGPALLLLALFIRRQVTTDRPLLPLAIFRDRVVVGVNAAHGTHGRGDVRLPVPHDAVPSAHTGILTGAGGDRIAADSCGNRYHVAESVPQGPSSSGCVSGGARSGPHRHGPAGPSAHRWRVRN